MPSLWDVVEAAGRADDPDKVTKDMFGELVHSDDPSKVEWAMNMLEAAGGYDNLPDE